MASSLSFLYNVAILILFVTSRIPPYIFYVPINKSELLASKREMAPQVLILFFYVIYGQNVIYINSL